MDRLTSPLRKGSSTEKREVPSYRHYLADLQAEEEEMSTERNRAASPRSRGRGGAGSADGADPAAGSTNPVVRTGKRREDGGRPRAQNRRGSGRRRRRSA